MPELTTFLTQNGFPEYALVWLFMLPIAMTVVVVSRQIIGIKGFGISIPLLIGFAYTATGLQAGVIIFLVALGAGFLMRVATRGLGLLYLPRMGLLLSGVVIAVFLIAPILPYSETLKFPQAIFSLIILIVTTEQFASYLIERDARKTLAVVLETLVVSATIFFVITWEWLQGVVISYPVFVIAGVIAFNIILGKWTGLRFLEYIRFKDVIFK